MADTPIYFRLFIDDYLRDAEELSLLEHGAYFRLMLFYYGRAKPITDNLERIYRRVGAESKEHREAVMRVLEEFFTLDGPVWRHKRIDKEIADWRVRSQKARESVAAREEKNKKNNASASSNDDRTMTERSSNQNQNHKVSTKTAPAARVSPPTLEEVRAYCLERQNGVDPEKWFNYYSANGWKVGRNSMKDWRAAIRTWEESKQPARAKKVAL